ncbi:MAG: winged helix DNA-binding domain-containing protein, partial [Chloroflexia bacterium]
MDITTQRLHNQHLTHQPLNDPASIVQHLGAVQAQEYAHAKWAIGMRSLDLTDADIEKAIADGEIIRTHLMRPTWHFVARDDIRWMLELTGPRVHTANNHYYKQSGLDTNTLKRSNDLMANALQGENFLTRKDLLAILEREGIPAGDTIRSSYIMMYAELEGVICSGPRKGKQFTYALISERAPKARTLAHDEALAELVKRYFSSHGPATIADFVWWSGLTVADTKRGLELNNAHLDSDTIDGTEYYFLSITSAESPVDASKTAYLLPIYDEYGNAYKRREALFDPSYDVQAKAGKLPTLPFQCQLVIGGKMLGTWKRTHTKNEVQVEAYYYRPLTQTEETALYEDVARY